MKNNNESKTGEYPFVMSLPLSKIGFMYKTEEEAEKAMKRFRTIPGRMIDKIDAEKAISPFVKFDGK